MPDNLPLIHLSRHSKTAWKLEGRIRGRVGIPLCEEGVAEAISLNGHLHGCDHRVFGDFSEDNIKPKPLDASHLRRVLSG